MNTDEHKNLHLEGLGDVELVEQPDSEKDHLQKFVIEPKEHLEMLPPAERLKRAFDVRKHPNIKFIFPKPSPRKYPTRLHKRIAKLEAEYETAGPLRQVRILKYAQSLTERTETGRSKHVNRRTHKRFRNQSKFYEIVKDLTNQK